MRTLTAILLCLAPLGAQTTPPKDVDGWGKIRWGMTITEARAAYPEATESADAYWSHLTLPAVKVGDIPLNVSVSAKKPSNQVSLISLWCYFGLSGPNFAPNVSSNDFETLKSLLIQKYGHQKNEEYKVEFGDPVRMFLWVFPSTSIQLKLQQTRGLPDAGSLHIEYRANDKKALDVL